MARLFITPREQDFISDLTKEIIKDVIGQKIYYYRVMSEITNIHDVYEEAINKHFDIPIELDATIDLSPQVVTTNNFGTEQLYTSNVYIHYRDVIDKDIEVREGDYYSYGGIFYEITSAIFLKEVYGEIEYKVGIQVIGKQARQGLIDRDPNGPTDIKYSDQDATQQTFVQQRGFSENSLGATGDVRSLQKQNKIEVIAKNPAEVSPRGDESDISSSFYGDEEFQTLPPVFNIVDAASEIFAISSLEADGIVEYSSFVDGSAIIAANSTLQAEATTIILPFQEDAIAFLDAYKLLSDGYETNDSIEVWQNSLNDSSANFSQFTIDSQPKFQESVDFSGVPGVIFDGIDDYMIMGDSWKLSSNGPWTLYFAARRNSSLSKALFAWSDNSASSSAYRYTSSLVSTRRTNYTINGVASSNQPVSESDPGTWPSGTYRIIAITKRPGNGFSVHINNLLLYETSNNGSIINPIKQPLFGARWNSTGNAIELFALMAVFGMISYSTAHDSSQRQSVFEFIAERYGITL